MRTTFQTKFFVAALSAALLALVVAGILFATAMRRQIDARIESTRAACRSPRSASSTTRPIASGRSSMRV
jgi:hypothetical protein